MKDTAICIFAYTRESGLKNLIKDIKKNQNFKKYEYYFFIDYPKQKKSFFKNTRIIKITDEFKKLANVKVIKRKRNYGLSKNILNGINFIKKRYKKFIILEDDLRISKFYLNYMQTLLNKYENDDKIYSITGYNFPKKIFDLNLKKFSVFLTKRPNSWAWGSWSKKWSKVNFENKIFDKIYSNKKKMKLISKYGEDLKFILRDTLNLKIESWAVKWTIYHILYNKYCIYPVNSLVNEEGFKYLPTNNFFRTKKFHHKSLSKKILKINKLKNENFAIINKIYNIYNFSIYKKIFKSVF